jgi:hypothetical protein
MSSASPTAPRSRPRIVVDGAEAVLAAWRTETAAGAVGGVAAARALAAHRVDWASIRAEIVAADRSVVLAGGEAGPILAARAFERARPTGVHDHGRAGAAIVVEGRQRYERFLPDERDHTAATLESIHDLAPGDVVWWGEPPDDVHRQHALDPVTIELVLLCGPVGDTATFTPTSPTEANDLRAAVIDGFLAGDITALRPWYHPDALFDLNVPHWRFQQRGRQAGLQQLHDEEFAQPGRRLTFIRVTDTAAGVLLETETRHTAPDGESRAWRELHQLRLRHGLVAQHVVWCTGILDGAASRRQFDTAPMERM